jgi:hypothetical protein
MWRLPALSLLSLALGLVAQAFAQQPPGRRDTIVVTGTWEPLPMEEADRAVASLPVREQSILFSNAIDFLQLDPSRLAPPRAVRRAERSFHSRRDVRPDTGARQWPEDE